MTGDGRSFETSLLKHNKDGIQNGAKNKNKHILEAVDSRTGKTNYHRQIQATD
jgi:hypothetical protein